MIDADYFRRHYQLNRERKLAAAKIWYAQNKEAVKAYRATRRDKDKAWKKEWDLQRAYGMSLAERDAMLAAQGGRCRICLSDNPRRKNGDWCVDHSHHTGAVRAILCSPCNKMIGLARESPAILDRAARYMEDFDDFCDHPRD